MWCSESAHVALLFPACSWFVLTALLSEMVRWTSEVLKFFTCMKDTHGCSTEVWIRGVNELIQVFDIHLTCCCHAWLAGKKQTLCEIYASYGSCSFPYSVLEKKRKEHWIFTVWAPLRDAHFILPCSEPLWSWKIYWSPRRGIEPRSPAWQAGILTTILSRITCLAAR